MLKSKMNLGLAAALLFAGLVQSIGQNPPAQTKEQVDKWVAVLQSGAGQKEKADACRELARVGSKDAVAPLAALLDDEKLSHMARYGLETIPDPSVDEALRAALGKLKGRLLAGVIGSLGVRRDAQAVPPLTAFLLDGDADVAQAAARALGKIATPEAAKALQGALAAVSEASRLAFCEGWLRCADAFAGKGQRAEALAIYDQLRSLQAPHQVRTAALRGAIIHRQQDGLPILLEQLRSGDFLIAEACVRAAQEMPGGEVAKALAAELNQLPVDKQILVIQTLGRQANAAALPALLTAAKSGAKPVRVEALRAIAEIRQPTAVPVLVELMSDPDAEAAQAAQECLASIPGPEADAVAVKMMGSSEASQRLDGMELAARRRMLSSLPTLLKAAEDADPKIRSSALKKVGELGTLAELPALLNLLKGPEVDAIQDALRDVCVRADNPGACAEALAGALAGAQPAQKTALLRVLSAVGGEQALKAVRAAAGDSNPQVHTAAVKALGTWKTADAAPVLLEMAKAAGNPADKMLCLRSYLDWADNPDVPAAQRLSLCQQAVSLVNLVEEKKLLLSALGNIPVVESLAVIAPYLDDAATKDDASAATVAVAEKLLRGNASAAKAAPKLIGPLQKAAEATGNATMAQRAKTLLQQAQAKAGAK